MRPTFKEVVTHLVATYELAPFFDEYYAQLEHRPEGWYLTKYDYSNTKKPIERVQIWDKTKGFNLTTSLYKFDKNITAAEITNTNFNYQQQLLQQESPYVINYYYGYHGWDWDVIQSLDLKTNKTTKEWEQLARSYTNYAMGYFSDQYGFVAFTTNPYRTPKKAGSIYEQERVDSFLYYSDKAIAAYKTILTLDPSYETPVGNIRYKYENERLDKALKLSIYVATEPTGAWWQNISYPDTFKKKYSLLAKVSSKPKLIFTWGDNDTYYLNLLNLQNKQLNNTVINYNLLASLPVLHALKRDHNNLRTDFRTSIYEAKNYINFNLLPINHPTIEWSVFKELISQPEQPSMIRPNTAPQIPLIIYEVGKHNTILNKEKNYYLLLNQIALWDLIYLNAAQYDIYLTVAPEYLGMPNEWFKSLDDSGNVFKLQ